MAAEAGTETAAALTAEAKTPTVEKRLLLEGARCPLIYRVRIFHILLANSPKGSELVILI